jgi:nucleoside-triphosphatase THEP1
VLLTGEPGIGKSRIAQTIVERINAEPNTRLRYFCSGHIRSEVYRRSCNTGPEFKAQAIAKKPALTIARVCSIPRSFASFRIGPIAAAGNGIRLWSQLL